MKSLIIGADVGGTNTDVVCMQDKTVIAFEKVPTTDDVTTGLQMAISNALSKLPKGEWSVTMVNIGTTHFVNALVQRVQLAPVAVVRLCGPSSVDFGPFDDYPDDLSAVIGAKCYFVNGGYQVDGSIITEVHEEEIIPVIQELKDSKIENIVISGIFSPVNNNQEKQVEQIFRKHYSGVSLTLSSDVGSIGLLERGNAAILNESFKPLCNRIISALSLALRELKLDCPFFFTQNDGTLVSPVEASDFPIRIMGCGAANSIRGASHLSGIQNGLVVDIGGTTTDIGSLNGGFPRQTSSVVSKAGLDLNCTMPDVLSIRLGGGSVVCPKPLINSIKVDVGPKSVGHTLTEAALTFGGSTLTATDVASAYLKVDVGDRDKVKVTTSVLEEANEVIQCMLEESVDRMKLSKEAVPVICVGGGSILRDKNRKVPGVTEFIQPPYYQVANAVGAALCQVSSCEEILLNMTGLSNTKALEKLWTRAFEKCLMNGAKRESIRVIEEDIGKMHLPGNITGAKVKVVGDFTDEALIKSKETTSAFLRSTRNLEAAVPKFQRVSQFLDEDPIQPQVPQVDEKTGEWILSEYDVQCISIGTAILGCVAEETQESEGLE
ncbi:putative D-/L-hydantoinase subunit A [Apostichopus japonicus]|uniref:putative D-/L-hydantoinase subunit A n=1 Tax=Stichopus japonicus TaxID=307972 RepID=UPI003AB7E66F